jgi:ribosomal protein S18 acetylase RimI-like enzyme
MTGQLDRPGFESVCADSEDGLIGFAYGLPLQADTKWWDGLDPEPEPRFMTEMGTRTFAVIDLGVMPELRGRGLGRRLMDELLAGRSESRATLAANPHNHTAIAMYERWGWQLAGRAPGGAGETEPEYDLYVIALGTGATSSR